MDRQTKLADSVQVDEILRKQVTSPDRSKKVLTIVAVVIGSILLLPLVLMMVIMTLSAWFSA